MSTVASSSVSTGRRVVSWCAPLVPLLAGGLVLGLRQCGPLDAHAASMAVVLACGVGIAALEHLWPARSSWAPTRRTLGVDVPHTLVSALVVAPGARAAAVLAASTTLERVAFTTTAWPRAWPPLAQLALALVVADFGVYWAHRAMHSTNLGWRIHAVHHSTERMNFWAAARSHPFNVIVTVFTETLPLLLLGAPAGVMTAWAAAMGVNGLLQHSNIDLPTTRWTGALATHEAHRLHHARVFDGCGANFGNTTMVWDRLFRTFRRPSDPTPTVGSDESNVPEHYGRQLLAPWRTS